jgi:hypothetical protein
MVNLLYKMGGTHPFPANLLCYLSYHSVWISIGRTQLLKVTLPVLGVK